MDDRKKFQIELHKELVKHYRNRHGSVIGRLYHEWWNDNLVEYIKMVNPSSSTVLDLGAGNGILSHHLALRGFRVVASDLSFDMLQEIAENTGVSGVVQSDGELLPFPPESFDAVVCRGVLHHVPHPEKMMSEVNRILKPGGAFVFAEPCSDGLLLRGIRWFYRKYSPKLGEDHRAFKSETLSSMAEYTGFTVIDIKKFGFVAFPLCGMTDYLPILTKFPRQESIFRVLNKFDETCSIIPGIRRESWGVTMAVEKTAGSVASDNFEADDEIPSDSHEQGKVGVLAGA